MRSIRRHLLCVRVNNPEAYWPKSAQAIQSIINNSPSRRLGGRAPNTALTGISSGNPLIVALTQSNVRNVKSFDQDELVESKCNMHKGCRPDALSFPAKG